MITYKKKKVTKEIPTHITCDICDTEYSWEDSMERQEFIHIKHGCGYSSVFKDMSSYSIDICQHCMKKIFGNEINLEE